MKILIAEDDPGELELYQIAFQVKGHKVTLARNGKECLERYIDAHSKIPTGETPSRFMPFDAVVLDYRIPIIDGLEAAKETPRLNKYQSIIFAQAYVKQTLVDSVKQLKQVVELIQKPFEPKVLVELVEDTSTTKELMQIDELVSNLSSKSDEQMDELLEVLKRVQKIGLC